MLLRREGHTINKKRTRRLWRDEGLRRPAPCKRKRTRPPGGGPLLRAERPNHVWALDFQFDETAVPAHDVRPEEQRNGRQSGS